MRVFLFPLLLSLVLTASADPADALRQSFRSMQGGFEEAVRKIWQEVATQEGELKKRLLESLGPLETGFQHQGDLEGLLAVRALRTSLVEASSFPELDPDAPQSLSDFFDGVLAERQALFEAGQAKLQDQQRQYAGRLEPVMRDLTRLGDFETAREILTIRRDIFSQLGEEESARTPAATGHMGSVTDPNVYPFSLEPASVSRVAGVTPRRTQVPYTPEIFGNVRTEAKHFLFRKGRYSVPAAALDALLLQTRQNQMLTLEIGYQTHKGNQGIDEGIGPVPLFYFGPRLEEANLAVTHEGQDLFLTLRTDRPPAGGGAHRIHLGRIADGRKAHLIVTYRSGELTVYHDGTETLKLRGQVTGSLEPWVRAPLEIGGAPAGGPRLEDAFWNGEIVWIYLRASLETGRGATAAYGRFANFIIRPVVSP